MAMGHMTLPENTLPMMTGEGQFGPVEMGGMFTAMKIRDGLGRNDYGDPGWYEHPAGTVAWKLEESANSKRPKEHASNTDFQE
jgi:hypothetical protein